MSQFEACNDPFLQLFCIGEGVLEREVKDLILVLLPAKFFLADFICMFDDTDPIRFIDSLDQFNMRLVTSPLVGGCSSSGSTDAGRPWWRSTLMDLECDVSVASPTTTISLPLAERGLFRVGSVRSITAGLSFRFRALISLIGWNMVSFMRSMSFLSLEACELVSTPPRSPGAAVCKGKRSCLAINSERLARKGD